MLHIVSNIDSGHAMYAEALLSHPLLTNIQLKTTHLFPAEFYNRLYNYHKNLLEKETKQHFLLYDNTNHLVAHSIDSILEWLPTLHIEHERVQEILTSLKPLSYYSTTATSTYMSHLQHHQDSSFGYFEIYKEEELLGRIVFELFDKLTPKAVQNFTALITGKNEKSLSYNNCPFHRITESYIQSGDVIDGSGKNSVSVISSNFIEDECFHYHHDSIGMVGLVKRENGKPHTNGSQFYITTKQRVEWLDRLNFEIIGRVIDGFDILFQIANQPCSLHTQRPETTIFIKQAGLLKIVEENQQLLYPSNLISRMINK